ncbi:MAG: T9SS type A sorting domain-containing protein [Calditrichota bacterium]
MKPLNVCGIVLLIGLLPLPVQSQDSSRVQRVGYLYYNPLYGYGTYSVALSGRFALIACQRNGLTVVDINDPEHPHEIGHSYLHDVSWDVASKRNCAYVADGEAGLRVIDISNPARPQEIGSYVDSSDIQFGWAYGVILTDYYAVVAYGEAGIHIVDISDSTRPRIVSSWNRGGGFVPHSVALSGVYIYIAGGSRGMQILDISNPESPSEVALCEVPGYASSVAVRRNYAYVAELHAGLRVIDISDPRSPHTVSIYETPGQSKDVAIIGNYALIADAYSGLRVIDVSDPTTPRETGYYDTEGTSLGVTIGQDNLVYVADGSSLSIFDCSEALGCNYHELSPFAFRLNPAFPNPFNTSTTLRYTVQQPGQVNLAVYDIVGRRVRELMSGRWLDKGEHTLSLSGVGLMSGTYLVRLGIGAVSDEQKVNLVK